ncbi:unnamed protein product, partial [Iphiclides podalirius]
MGRGDQRMADITSASAEHMFQMSSIICMLFGRCLFLEAAGVGPLEGRGAAGEGGGAGGADARAPPPP